MLTLMLPFWMSIALLSLAQGAVVALPRAVPLTRLETFRDRRWAIVPPLSVIVSDYFHWSAMGDYRFDPEEWPDPKAMVDELRDLGVELMVSVWPTVSPLSENYPEFRDAGLLVASDQGIDAHQTSRDKGMAAPMAVSFYDPTNPATREYVWELIRKNYVAHGIGIWTRYLSPGLDAQGCVYRARGRVVQRHLFDSRGKRSVR